MQLDYSFGFIALCLGAGILYAGILYFRTKQFKPAILWTVSFLRFALVSLVCFFLLSPATRILNTEVEKPKILWIQDNSISVGLNKDSLAWREEFNEKTQALAAGLDIDWITVPLSENGGEEMSFNAKTTNLSEGLSQNYATYFNQNIAAVVLASDGLYNRGFDPRYVNNQNNWPVYTWVYGDTALQVDAKIESVYHNKIAYKGNRFPVEINTSVNTEFEALRVTLTKDGKTLRTKTLKSGENKANFTFLISENEVGLQAYRVVLEELAGEKNLSNNAQMVYVNIVENKKKILLVSKQTHPDLGAFQAALKEVEEYEVALVHPDDVLAPLTDIDLLILHQLPEKGERKLSNYLSSFKGNVLYLEGGKTSYNYLNRYQDFFTYQSGNEMESVGVHGSQVFTKFNLDEDVRSFFQSAPKLWSNQSAITFNGNHENLYQSRIFSLNTEQPVMSFGELGGASFGLINGEGIWKWRLYDYRENGNHDNFNTLIRQMVRFLVSKESLERFRVEIPSRVMSNKPLSVVAELYNPAFELSVTGEVTVIFKNEEDQRFSYKLNPSGNIFKTVVNGLPSGKYTYRATAELGEERFMKTGGFFIEPVEIELLETRANYPMMQDLAESNSGRVLMDGDWNTLQSELENLNPPSIAHQNERLEQWINLKGFFFLLLALVSLEWFLRKRNGAY